MPGSLGDALFVIILGAILFFLSLAMSGMIGRWIVNWLHYGDDIFFGYCICFCFWVVVISFGIFFARGNALPESLLWLLGWPEPHK